MSAGLSQQATAIQYMQGTSAAGATANGNGTPAELEGYNGAIQVEISESAGGTCTVALQGSFDGTNWITGVGYYTIDNQATLTRTVANISVTASQRHVYQILDPYPQLRAVVSSVANSCAVTARAYCVPA